MLRGCGFVGGFLVLAAAVFLLVGPAEAGGVSRVLAGRSWSVSPASDVEPGSTLLVSGMGCAKAGTPSGNLEVVVNSSLGLLGYARVSADGSWHLTSAAISLPGGLYVLSLTAGCLDDGGSLASSSATTVFAYKPTRDVTFAGALALAAFPLQAIVGRRVADAIGFFSFPLRDGAAVAPSQFSATVGWGDGASGLARIVAAPAALTSALPNASGYLVEGAHTYRSALAEGRLTLTVHPLRAGAVHASAFVLALPVHPVAFFVANPPAGVQDGISLMMPSATQPGQQSIVQHRWRFLDDYNPVVDDAQTAPVYAQTIAGLASDPGNAGYRTQGVALGILPTDANSLIGGLSDDSIRQVANVWKAYWPSHIVPHLYDEYGAAGVELTTVDSGGQATSFQRNVAISRDCLKWGGPLSGLFGGFTVCDTYNGIATQFGPHRPADWVSLDISDKLGGVGKALKFGNGVSLVVTRAALQNPNAGVFLSLHLDAGVGISLGGSLGLGWVGPPDPNNTPADPSSINSFVNGLTVDGGFAVQVGIGQANLGLGFDAIYSPSVALAGEEIFRGASGASASVGASCSWPISDLPPAALTVLTNALRNWGRTSTSVSSSQISTAATALLKKLGGFDLLAVVPQALANCKP